MEVPQPEVLAVTYRRAAALSGLHERSIRRAVADGQLPVVRLGAHCVRILLKDLEAWLASQRQPQQGGE